MLSVGTPAPDFALEDQSRNVIRLSDYRGQKAVVVAFHPFAFTPVCTRQMEGYQSNWSSIEAMGVQVVGISTDAGPSKAAWARSMGGLSFPLLTDHYPHGQVAQSYGVLGDHGLADRSVFVVDKSGRIAWAKHYGMDNDPPLDELMDELRKLGSR